MGHRGAERSGFGGHVAAIAPTELKPLARISRRNRMRDIVRSALVEDRIVLARQPVVAAQPPHMNAFSEGLLRLRLPDGRMLSPGAILPLIAGLPEAVALDLAVLRLALSALARDPALRLSINVAPTTIATSSWLQTLERVGAERSDVCYRLIVEITETDCLDSIPGIAEIFAAIRATGANLALDDFGAGQTAFSYFRNYRFDIVKIDGAYCAGLARNRDAQCLVRALVEIARHFEMLTVAEFIDDQEDAAAACRLGIDCLQGHLFGAAAVPGAAEPIRQGLPA